MLEKHRDALQKFFEKDVALRATAPLKNGTEIALYIDGQGPLSLGKSGGKPVVSLTPPNKPQLTFWLTSGASEKLTALQTEDIGEVGIAILQLMASQDPNEQISAKVHAGMFELLTKGYLGVLPLGGSTVMKFLATKGFTSMGKIKDAMSKMKG